MRAKYARQIRRGVLDAKVLMKTSMLRSRYGSLRVDFAVDTYQAIFQRPELTVWATRYYLLKHARPQRRYEGPHLPHREWKPAAVDFKEEN